MNQWSRGVQQNNDNPHEANNFHLTLDKIRRPLSCSFQLAFIPSDCSFLPSMTSLPRNLEYGSGLLCSCSGWMQRNTTASPITESRFQLLSKIQRLYQANLSDEKVNISDTYMCLTLSSWEFVVIRAFRRIFWVQSNFAAAAVNKVHCTPVFLFKNRALGSCPLHMISRLHDLGFMSLYVCTYVNNEEAHARATSERATASSNSFTLR